MEVMMNTVGTVTEQSKNIIDRHRPGPYGRGLEEWEMHEVMQDPKSKGEKKRQR